MRQPICLVALALVMVSCGTRSGFFKIEGMLLNLNQGEFYVYSPDGVFDGVDTIKVAAGRFTYQTRCKREGTLMIVFPNYSEQPVFAQPGKFVTIKGDASHLREISVKGTRQNDLMNSLRKRLSKATPPEEAGVAEGFILENPRSPVSVYALSRYIISADRPDYDKALGLARELQEQQPGNGMAARAVRQASMGKSGAKGAAMPSFSARDIYGKPVTQATLKGKVAVVYAWASWSPESTTLRDRLNRAKADSDGKLAIMGINLDPSRQACKQSMRTDSTSQVTICDGLMFDCPLMDKFALGNVPDNIVYDTRGKVVARGLDPKDLEERLKDLLK